MTLAQIAAIALLAVGVFWTLGAYNRLVALRNGIGAAWTHVDAVLGQRGESVGPLVTALRAPLASEGAALDAMLSAQAKVAAAADALRARPVLALLATAQVQAENEMASASSRLLSLIELHPELLQDVDVAARVDSLRAAEPRLGFARQLFNDAVQTYNDALRQFPTRLLARLFGMGTAARI